MPTNVQDYRSITLFGGGKVPGRSILNDYSESVNDGEVAGVRDEVVIGTAPDVDTVVVDIWDRDEKYVFLPALTTCEILSTDINDTEFGTGARIVRVIPLVDDFAEHDDSGNRFVDIVMNGTTPVPIPFDILRTNDFRVVTAGGSGFNEGTIQIREQGGGIIVSQMNQQNNLALSSVFTVPKGLSGMLLGGFATVNNGSGGGTYRETDMQFLFRPNLDNPQAVFYRSLLFGVTNQFEFFFPKGMCVSVEQKTDMVIEAVGDGNNNQTTIAYKMRLKKMTT